MGKTYVKNGTPVGDEPLCKRCRNGQYVTGYRESDILVRCCLSTPLTLPFVVHSCSDFDDKHKPDWQQMQKLAIEIEPIRVSKKTRGFNLPNPLQPEKSEYEPALPDSDDEEEDEQAETVAQTILQVCK